MPTKENLGNFLNGMSATKSFQRDSQQRLARIEAIGQWVDVEASASAQSQLLSMNREVLRTVQSPSFLHSPSTYHELPFIRSTKFYGRVPELQSLWENLQPKDGENSQALRQSSIYGLGGVGKTQLALEFTYKYSSMYDAIFWIEAESQIQLAESFSRHALALGIIHESIQNVAQIRDALKRWLYRKSRQGTTHP